MASMVAGEKTLDESCIGFKEWKALSSEKAGFNTLVVLLSKRFFTYFQEEL